MPHVVTGEIRKDIFTKEGNGWTLFKFELSESFKRKNDEKRTYTNYSVTLFANSDAMLGYFEKVLQKGRVISVSSESLGVNQRETDDGRVFVTLEMIEPKIVFSQFEPSAGHSGQQQQRQPQGKGQAVAAAQRQISAQNNAAQQGAEPPMNFDDDIPF